VWAKSDAVVKRVKYGAPHIRAGHILMNETAAVREEGMDVVFRLTETEVIGAHHAMVDHSLRGQVHGAGKQLYGWTADRPDIMHRLLDVGVDAIVTSHPQRLKSVMEVKIRQCKSKTEM